MQDINPILVYNAQSSYMAFIRFYIEAWKFWLKLTIIFQICYSYHIFGCRLLSKPFLFGVHPTNINIKFPVYSMKRLFLFNQNTYLNLQIIITFQANLIIMSQIMYTQKLITALRTRHSHTHEIMLLSIINAL